MAQVNPNYDTLETQGTLDGTEIVPSRKSGKDTKTTIDDIKTYLFSNTIVVTKTNTAVTEATTLNITDTRTGVGSTGWAAKFDLEANVALGAYANATYGYLAFGASGRVTGLAAGVCSEIVLSAGCTQGTYAGLEVELGMPNGAQTGTQTSLLYLSVYGADASTFDTNGYLFSLVGVTKNTNKVYSATTTGATARPTEVLRVNTPDGIRYLPLYSTVACGV